MEEGAADPSAAADATGSTDVVSRMHFPAARNPGSASTHAVQAAGWRRRMTVDGTPALGTRLICWYANHMGEIAPWKGTVAQVDRHGSAFVLFDNETEHHGLWIDARDGK